MLSLTHLTEAATELLNTADKRASERIGVVRTPAVDDEAGPGDKISRTAPREVVVKL